MKKTCYDSFLQLEINFDPHPKKLCPESVKNPNKNVLALIMSILKMFKSQDKKKKIKPCPISFANQLTEST